MSLHDLIEKLRKTLNAREPEDWPIPIAKKELRLLLDAIEAQAPPPTPWLVYPTHALG